MFDDQKIVIDNGTGFMKAGFSSESKPSVIFESIVGAPKYDALHGGSDLKDFYVGADVIKKKGILNLSYPIEDAIVSNWTDMEQIWLHTYDELRIEPYE